MLISSMSAERGNSIHLSKVWSISLWFGSNCDSLSPTHAIREVGMYGTIGGCYKCLSRTTWGSYGSQISEKHIKETGMEQKILI